MALPPPSPRAHEYDRLIQAVRLELEDAGNPAFLVAVLDPEIGAQASPVIFSSVRPCNTHAERLAREMTEGQEAFIVSRQAHGARQTYEILAPRTLKKLHRRLEVIESSFAAQNGPI